MRYFQCLGFGSLLAGTALLAGGHAFAEDFDYDLKARPPTIKITTPPDGQSVSPVDLKIRWEALENTGEFLGFAVENVETGKRVFFGDSFGVTGKHVARTVEALRPGAHRIIGYHYQETGDWTLAGVGPEFWVHKHIAPFWSKWGEPEKLCRHFAATTNYRIEGLKKITCTEGRCVEPKFYWLVGTDWALLDDLPSSLGEDKTILKVRCLPPPDGYGPNEYAGDDMNQRSDK